MNLLKKVIVLILTIESRIILWKYKPFVVVVTGSVGKTSTKDAIYSVLKHYSAPDGKPVTIRKSEKSMNGDIGLPLTIIGAPNAWRSLTGWMANIYKGLVVIFDRGHYPQCLVLELGADHPGDISRPARWLKPDIAIITKVSDTPVHVEFFDSPEQVFEEKASLASAVKKGGSLILFIDDAKVASIANRVKDQNISVTSFGMNGDPTVKGSDYSVMYEQGVPTGFSFVVGIDGVCLTVNIKNILGSGYMYSLLAAAAVGKVRGMKPEMIANGLSEYLAPNGRMNIIPGLNGSTIIDDTYNSSPDAVVAALDSLKMIEIQPGAKKIAVLGDMMELGKYSVDEHKKIGREVATALGQTGVLVAIGLRARDISKEAQVSGMTPDRILSFESSNEAAVAIPSIVQSGDIILVKGSQSPRLERVTKALMREPEKASQLLVRQEKEWLDKA